MSRFSAKLMEHYESPFNRGPMVSPDAVGVASLAGSPPYVSMFLRLHDEQIVEAQFEAAGCGVTIACGSMLSTLVRGKAVAECRGLTPEDLIHALDGLPPDKRYSADVVVGALRDALSSLQPSTSDSVPAGFFSADE